MVQKASPRVIWMGPSDGAAYGAVIQALGNRGMPPNVCPSLANLINSLVDRDNPVVVACDQKTQHRALNVVAILDKLASRVPLVVLAEEPDFGEYYYLMNHGATGYFQVGEDPEFISHAIERAALAG